MTLEPAVQQMLYLDHSYSLQQSFQGTLGNSCNTGIIINGLAKKLADSGIGYKHLQQVFDKHGKQGLHAILTNPVTSSGDSPNCCGAHGTTDPVVIHHIISHF